MTEILLTSERFVKDATSISDNIAGKFLLPSIREVQDTRLRDTLGTCLLNKVKSLVPKDEHTGERPIDDPANAAYKDLLQRAQYFLAYAAAAEVCMKTSMKVNNTGVHKTSDEHDTPATYDEMAKTKDYYVFKSDAALADLQRWLLANRAALPELTDCTCNAIRAHLRSAASSGLWLGGARGKIVPGGGGGCCR